MRCRCGALVVDQTDGLPHKAHFIPDQERDAFMDALDQAVLGAGGGEQEKEAALVAVTAAFSRATRVAYQCAACGRLYVDDPHGQAMEFVPADGAVPREIFRTRPSPAR